MSLSDEDKLLNICSFTLLGINYSTMLLPLLLEIAIIYTNYSNYRYGGNVKSSKIGKIKTIILDVLVILSFCIIALQNLKENNQITQYLIEHTEYFINLFSSIITIACMITLIDYTRKNKEIRKNPKAVEKKYEKKKLKKLKHIMNDLLNIKYYEKHKEEPIIKQFYI